MTLERKMDRNILRGVQKDKTVEFYKETGSFPFFVETWPDNVKSTPKRYFLHVDDKTTTPQIKNIIISHS